MSEFFRKYANLITEAETVSNVDDVVKLVRRIVIGFRGSYYVSTVKSTKGYTTIVFDDTDNTSEIISAVEEAIKPFNISIEIVKQKPSQSYNFMQPSNRIGIRIKP